MHLVMIISKLDCIGLPLICTFSHLQVFVLDYLLYLYYYSLYYCVVVYPKRLPVTSVQPLP